MREYQTETGQLQFVYDPRRGKLSSFKFGVGAATPTKVPRALFDAANKRLKALLHAFLQLVGFVVADMTISHFGKTPTSAADQRDLEYGHAVATMVITGTADAARAAKILFGALQIAIHSLGGNKRAVVETLEALIEMIMQQLDSGQLVTIKIEPSQYTGSVEFGESSGESVFDKNLDKLALQASEIVGKGTDYDFTKSIGVLMNSILKVVRDEKPDCSELTALNVISDFLEGYRKHYKRIG